MKRVKNVIFNKFSIDLEDSISSQTVEQHLSKHVYTDKAGFGFNSIIESDNEISASLLKRSPTYVQDYNAVTNEIEKKQIFLFISISFNINFEQKILTVYGSLSNLNILKSVFRNIFDFNYQIELISLNLYSFTEKLYKKDTKYTLQQISIKGFNYDNGMIGRFTGDVTKQSTGLEIINNYKLDIVKITFSIEIDNEDSIKIQVFPNGSIKFVSDEDNYIFYLNYIKTLIFD